MKSQFSVLFFSTLLFSFAFGNLQGPDDELLDKSKQYERKSSKGLDQESSIENEKPAKDESEDNSESEPFIKILAEDLNYPSSGIKIIKAPDLSKDSDSKKISETLARKVDPEV
jgi:hypothetical protein